MKVLMINVVCGIRSTGRICTDLATALEQQGHEVKIAYGRENVPEQFQKYAVRIGSELDTKIHGMKARFFDSSGLESRKATLRFLKWAEIFNPDLLWLHNIHGYYINYEALFEWIKHRPNMEVKWTLHDCWAFTGHCSYFTMCGCQKWITGCYKCPQKKEYPKSLLFDNSRNNYRKKKKSFLGVKNLTLITPSKWLADLTRNSFLKDYPVEVQYNTINYSVFKPVLSDFKKKHDINNKMVLGVASIWDKRKGLEDFLELAQIRRNDVTVVLVGLTLKQIKKIPPYIVAIEKTNSPNELAEIYSAADVFFLPTHEDNYPTVCLEAEACGTRVVTYDVGGSSETITRKDSVVVNNLMEAIDVI